VQTTRSNNESVTQQHRNTVLQSTLTENYGWWTNVWMYLIRGWHLIS